MHPVRVVGNNYDDSEDYDGSFEFGYCGKCARLVHSGKGLCFHCGGAVAFPEEPALADLVSNVTAISQSLFCTVCGTITAPRKVTEQRKAGLLTSRTETVESTVCSHCGREYEFGEASGTTFIGTGSDDADFAVEFAVSPIFDWDKPTKTWTGQIVSMRALRDAATQRVKPDAPDKTKAISEEFTFWEIKFILDRTKSKEKDIRESHVFWKAVYEGNLWGAAQATAFSNSVNAGMIQNSLYRKGYGDRSAHLRFMSESFQALGVLERVNNYLSHKLGTNDLSEIIYGDELFHDSQIRQRFLDMVGIKNPGAWNAPSSPTSIQGVCAQPMQENPHKSTTKDPTVSEALITSGTYNLADYIEVVDLRVNIAMAYVDWARFVAGVQKKNPDGTYSSSGLTWRQEKMREGILNEKSQLGFIDHRTKSVWYWYGLDCAGAVTKRALFMAARMHQKYIYERNEGNIQYLKQKQKPWLADSTGYYLHMVIQNEEPEDFWTLFDSDVPLPQCLNCSVVLKLDKEKKVWNCPKCSEFNFLFPYKKPGASSPHQHTMNFIGAVNFPGEPAPYNIYECMICHERFIG